MIQKLLQDKAIRYGLFGIAGVIVLIIGLLIPVGHGDKELERMEAAIDTLKIAVAIAENRTLPAYDDSGLCAIYDKLQKQINDFAAQSGTDLQAIKDIANENAARLSEQQGYISGLELAVHDLKQMGGLDQNAVKTLQDSFKNLAENFAVLKANQTGRVKVSDVIIAGTGYINSDCILADVLIIIENTTMFDILDRNISLVIKADSDIPAIRTAALGGVFAGNVWNYDFQEGRYIYFTTANPINIVAGATIGYELKLKLYFTSSFKTVTNFEAEAQIN